MTYNLAFTADSVKQKYGGLYWAYQRCNSDGSPLTIADTWHLGVYRIKSDPSHGSAKTQVALEDGSQISQDDVLKSEITITSIDDSANTENFLINEAKNSYFHICMDCGLDVGATKKYRHYGIVEIEPLYKTSSPGRDVPIKMLPQYNANAVSLTGMISLSAWLPVSLSSVTVAAGAYYSVTAV
jgi:hypothetical protein